MPYNDRLFFLLGELEDQELEQLWCEALRCSLDKDDFAAGSRDWRIGCLSREWRSAHGHTLLNLARSPHELPWKRILIDVADKLKPGWGWTAYRMDDDHTDEAIEAEILRLHDERIREAWDKLEPEEREKLADSIDEHISRTSDAVNRSSHVAGARIVTVTSLGNGVSAGLLTGAGALALAQGSGAALVGGLLGGTLYQLGLWLVVRVFGVWSGAQLVASGGAAAVGGALLSAPAAAVMAAHAVMTTSYSKTIPATLTLLTAHALRRQLAQLEAAK
jgi:uncharacterized protein YaaW (UPF0174 family)